jgi:uncharacterized protein (TIGR02145 family)
MTSAHISISIQPFEGNTLNLGFRTFILNIKTLFTGLIAVSVCIAQPINISGKVTDTGTTPISGAVVRLEKGGQTTTTGEDGSFALTTTTAILPLKGTVPQNGLSVSLSGNLLNVSIAQQSAVEVTTLNLSGKALSTVRTTLDAGSHSLSLPCRGTGNYLYKVKSGNSAFVLKGTAFDGASSQSQVESQGSLPKSPVQQATIMSTINDVIVSTKDGYLNYRCVIENPDTSGIAIKMIANAGNVIDTDGNVYQTVRIGNQIWTVENLRVTKYNDGSAIPFDTSKEAWKNATTPKYCFVNNTIHSDSIKKFGALYNWYVVNPANTRKIAPVGWHIPTYAEWDTLQNYLIANGYTWDGSATGYAIAKSLAAKTDWWTYSGAGKIGCDLTKNNRSGFSALPC